MQHPETSWQLRRVSTAYEALDREGYTPAEVESALRQFFLESWQLKDWIKNDIAMPAWVARWIEHRLAMSRPLMMCADLANRWKHLSLRSERVGARFESRMHFEELALSKQGGTARISWKFWVVLPGERIEARTVAKSCMDDWTVIMAELRNALRNDTPLKVEEANNSTDGA